MTDTFIQSIADKIKDVRSQGLYKEERQITSAQSAHIRTLEHDDVINLCANNYLGLSNHPKLKEVAKKAIDEHGFGLSSVRFICGTQKIHKDLEEKLSRFLGTEDTILYSSCFDANGGLFETILEPEDAVISDSLNHASIIDGIRLCKAQRYRYANNNMDDLESKLQEARENGARYCLIATDGVFSMDGYIANLRRICDLAEKYDAMVMVDDSHAVGFIGEKGRGTHEYNDVMGRVHIITGTLGKALGGASGGYTSGRREVIEWLRQRSRPYLFSNSLAPVIAATSIEVIELLQSSSDLRDQLKSNSLYFRSQMESIGFRLLPGHHPIIPVMIDDAALAAQMSKRLMELGVYAISFSFPVVPKGQARIRTQMSAAHSQEDLNKAIEAFSQAGRELKII